LKSPTANNRVNTDSGIRNETLVYYSHENNSSQTERNPLFDQKLDIATEGLEPYYIEHLKTRISKENALTIANYVFSMKVETNISINHRRGIITSLKLLSEFLENKSFNKMTRDDILLFLDNLNLSSITKYMLKESIRNGRRPLKFETVKLFAHLIGHKSSDDYLSYIGSLLLLILVLWAQGRTKSIY
jgi:hypothetical protein